MLPKPSISFSFPPLHCRYPAKYLPVMLVFTHLLRLLCAKTTCHRLTLLCGIPDVTNAAKLRHAYSPSEIVAQDNTFFYHWLYRRGVLELLLLQLVLCRVAVLKRLPVQCRLYFPFCYLFHCFCVIACTSFRISNAN